MQLKNKNSVSQKNYRAKVLLFDMDGTLVDSTAVVERTWHRFAQRHGLSGSAILQKAHGRRTAETVAFFATKDLDIEAETAKLVSEEIADVEGIKEVAGAGKLLRDLPANRWAVVTSANRELAIRRMEAANLPIPKIMITAEDVKQGKPAPDGYLAAAAALGVAPESCLVFEDAPAGVLAGVASGMAVVAIGQHIKKAELFYNSWMLDFTKLEIAVPEVNEESMRLAIFES